MSWRVQRRSRSTKRNVVFSFVQGLETLTADGLQVVLGHASGMVMKDSLFIGELPLSALGDITEV